MAKIEIPLKKDYAGAFKYWVDTNTENGVCTIPEYICKGIVGMLGKQPVATDTNVGDTISRQAAIDALKRKTFRLTFAEEQNCEGHVAWSADAVYSDVMEGELLELPPAQPEQRWIPCSERLPETDEFVLVSLSGRYKNIRFEHACEIADYADNEWFINTYPGMTAEIANDLIEAWMPLPEPYKEGETT